MGVKYYWNTRIILTLFFLNVHVSLNSLKWVVIAKEMAVNYFGITSVLGQFFVEEAINGTQSSKHLSTGIFDA